MDEVERPPWWMSGDDASEGASSSAPEPNWMSLLGSLGSWAGELWASSGAGDHANHQDPDDHPECIVCRAVVTFSTAAVRPRELPAVRWLPTRRL